MAPCTNKQTCTHCGYLSPPILLIVRLKIEHASSTCKVLRTDFELDLKERKILFFFLPTLYQVYNTKVAWTNDTKDIDSYNKPVDR